MGWNVWWNLPRRRQSVHAESSSRLYKIKKNPDMNINSWLQSSWPRVRQSIVISGRQRLQTQSQPVGFFHTCFTSSPPTQTGRKTHTDSTLFVDVHTCLFFFLTKRPWNLLFFLSSHFLFLLFKRARLKLSIHIEKWKINWARAGGFWLDRLPIVKARTSGPLAVCGRREHAAVEPDGVLWAMGKR